MDSTTEKAISFMISELEKARIKITPKQSGREAIDYIINTKDSTYNVYFQSLDYGIYRSIKILKQDLGELKDNLLIGLILLIDNEIKVFYLMPSKVFLNPNSIFKSNDVMLEHLSNWEIIVSANAIPELSKYALENIVDEL